MVQSERNKLFVFGDNLKREGFGGQAKSMRGERNAVGIPTKRKPERGFDAYFSNQDFPRFLRAAEKDIERLLKHSVNGVVIWPKDGIGTGLAQLPTRAPIIWKYIENIRKILEKISKDK